MVYALGRVTLRWKIAGSLRSPVLCHTVMPRIVKAMHICLTRRTSWLYADTFITSRNYVCFPRRFSCDSRDTGDLEKNYKDVMASVPQPVVVVTTAYRDPDQGAFLKRGLTCSSFTSVSLRPCIVSFAVNIASRMHNLLLTTNSFAVHILSKDQVGLSVHFSQPATDGMDQFDGIPHHVDQQGLPILENVCSVLKCQPHSMATIGDHHMWYGQVHQVQVGPHQDPMLFYHRSYRSVGDETFMQAFEERTLPFDRWNHKAHIRMAWNYICDLGKDEALPQIRSGIQRYNEKNKDKVNQGYNETVTCFYTHMIAEALQRHNRDSTFEEFLHHNEHLLKWDLLFQYYSKQLISCEDAKRRFLDPDKKKLP